MPRVGYLMQSMDRSGKLWIFLQARQQEVLVKQLPSPVVHVRCELGDDLEIDRGLGGLRDIPPDARMEHLRHGSSQCQEDVVILISCLTHPDDDSPVRKFASLLRIRHEFHLEFWPRHTRKPQEHDPIEELVAPRPPVSGNPGCYIAAESIPAVCMFKAMTSSMPTMKASYQQADPETMLKAIENQPIRHTSVTAQKQSGIKSTT